MQTDLCKLIDSLHYLMEEEQYEELYIQLQFAVPILLEQGERQAVKELFERAIPLLLEQHQLVYTRSLLELVISHVPKSNPELYSLLQLALGHVYFLLDERTSAITHYRESLSYLMRCEPIPFARIGIAQSNLAILTESEDSIETQLSYGRIISVLRHMSATPSDDLIVSFSFYYETCLRAKRFDEAQQILAQWAQLDLTASTRQQLQFAGYTMMFHHAQQQYAKALTIGRSILETFDHTKNIAALLSVYTIVIECYTMLDEPDNAAQLQQQRKELEQQLIGQRQEITQRFPIQFDSSLPRGSSFSYITEQMETYDKPYIVVIFDLSTNDKPLHIDYLQQLHSHIMDHCDAHLLYSAALRNYQSLYVFRDEQHNVHAELQSLQKIMPFPLTFGYCTSTHAENFTFEQCMQMCFAYIYYAYSQKKS